ncbi:MAG: hypothetical protein ACLPKB_24720 [Xanthobacteraceae bacterium]
MPTNKPYGKDDPERFIEGALTGGTGPSNGIEDEPIGEGQTIKRAYALDNVRLAMPICTSLMEEDFPGGPENLDHSLIGASAVNDEVGAASEKGRRGNRHLNEGGEEY